MGFAVTHSEVLQQCLISKRGRLQIHGCTQHDRTWRRFFTFFGRPFEKRFALCYQTVVCPVLSCLSVCDVRALWPNGWTDQDETWRAGRPRPWPHCVRWGPSSHPPKGHSSHPIFGPYLLLPNGCMDQLRLYPH